MTVLQRQPLAIGLFAVLALIPVVAAATGQGFFVDFFSRIIILATAAFSLGLILNYGGMSSFGHAIYLGIGAYSVGILTRYGISNGWVHLATAIAMSSIIAALVGTVALRTRNIHFIMITLAFGQMFYFLMISLREFGGDDGMTIARPSQFGSFVDLGNSTTLYYACLAVLLLFALLSARLVKSRFGMALRGSKSNNRRMAALGFPTFRYRLAAFTIAGAMCGVAGMLAANQSLFVSPEIGHWSRASELLIIVVVGGMGSLVGPIIGAIVFLSVEYFLASFTQHWQGITGVLIILLVLFERRGMLGILDMKRWLPKREAQGASAGE